MNQVCKFCKKEFNFEKNQQFITHVSSCKFNTNKEERYKKMSKTIQEKKKNYEFECKKCKKKYTLSLTENAFKKEKFSKFCNISCANSRIISKETKDKIKNGVNYFYIKNNKNREIEEKECLQCGNKFQTNKKSKFCSNKCNCLYNLTIIKLNGVSNETKNKISNTRKDLFKDYKLKVTGGTTKWYTVITSNGEIRVQGTYEVITCKILDCLKIKNEIKNWEYTNDRVEYINSQNIKCTYLLDFKIIENDNNFHYIETKGYKKENDELKWQSVRNKGLKLNIWYKKDIEYMANKYNFNIKSIKFNTNSIL
jgi:hypothetical protein